MSAHYNLSSLSSLFAHKHICFVVKFQFEADWSSQFWSTNPRRNHQVKYALISSRVFGYLVLFGQLHFDYSLQLSLVIVSINLFNHQDRVLDIYRAPTKSREGNVFSCVCLFWGVSHVTITYGALDLTVQGPPWKWDLTRQGIPASPQGTLC